MSKEIIMFGNNEVGKHRFHHRKNLVFLEDVLIKNLQVSSMVSSVKKNYK